MIVWAFKLPWLDSVGLNNTHTCNFCMNPKRARCLFSNLGVLIFLVTESHRGGCHGETFGKRTTENPLIRDFSVALLKNSP